MMGMMPVIDRVRGLAFAIVLSAYGGFLLADAHLAGGDGGVILLLLCFGLWLFSSLFPKTVIGKFVRIHTEPNAPRRVSPYIRQLLRTGTDEEIQSHIHLVAQGHAMLKAGVGRYTRSAWNSLAITCLFLLMIAKILIPRICIYSTVQLLLGALLQLYVGFVMNRRLRHVEALIP